MAEGGKRPGGLTALAVLNFVFGGLGVIGLLGTFALLSAADSLGAGLATEAMAQIPGAGMIYASIALGLVCVILLIVSGVGYIGQKKFLGKALGNTYSVLSIINGVLGIVSFGVGIMGIIGLIYPVLTLILLNTTFKADFVN